MAASFDLDKGVSLVEGVAQAIRDRVIHRVFEPGEKLTEARLAQELGVSRTPIREALRLLEAEGVVRVVAGRGLVVAKYSYEDLVNLYAVREALEALAARLCAENASSYDLMGLTELVDKMRSYSTEGEKNQFLVSSIDFHDAIAQASKNATLISFLKNVYTTIRIFRRAALDQPERGSGSFEEHAAIAEAIKQRNPELAETRAREHVRKAVQNVARLGVKEMMDRVTKR